MLITRLVEYAQNEGLTAADPFFEVKAVRWLILISPKGEFVRLIKLGDEKRGLEYSVPKKVGGNAGGVATFGTDNPRFVLGYTENPDAKKAERDLAAFAALVGAAAALEKSATISSGRGGGLRQGGGAAGVEGGDQSGAALPLG